MILAPTLSVQVVCPEETVNQVYISINVKSPKCECFFSPQFHVFGFSVSLIPPKLKCILYMYVLT